MALNDSLTASHLLDIFGQHGGLNLDVLSGLQNSPQPGTFAIGNEVLGLHGTTETGDPHAPGAPGTALLNANVLDDIGHGRLESIDLDVLHNNAGASFQHGDSAYQPNGSLGSLLDGNAANGFDGNNIEDVHLTTIVHGLDVHATWDNSGDTNASPAPVDILSPAIHGDALAGLGGGELHDVSIGDLHLNHLLG